MSCLSGGRCTKAQGRLRYRRTLAFVRKELADMGLQPVDCGRAGLVALVGGKKPGKGYCYPQHHPMAKFDESVLPGGSAVYAYMALRWLEDHKE